MLQRILTRLTGLAACIAVTMTSASGQSLFDEMILDGETVSASADTTTVKPVVKETRSTRQGRQRRNPRKQVEKVPSLWDLTDANGMPLDSTYYGPQELLPDPYMDVDAWMMPRSFYMPAVFISYDGTLAGKVAAEDNPLAIEGPDPEKMNWADKTVIRDRRQQLRFQRFMIEHPELVPYNLESMPRAPKEFVMTVDPSTAKINVTEFTRDVKEMTGTAPKLNLGRINWLHTFDGSLQFSQAYISPNWYQGGKSNLNMIANLVYNIKLNQKFHPDVMFETNVAYKLGVNNAPDDTVHNYNISEDLFQVNMRFGIKAMRHWYYSVNTQFKTQLLNSYRINSDNLVSSFLSPGQLNVGVGMTYSVQNRRNTVRFNASLAPLSYNLKTCTNSRLNPTAFGIEEGRTTKSEYGSSVELTFYAKLAYNITYNTRLFAFTNYEYLQGDWEHTVDFAINRFLTTRIYAHLRYDSQTKRLPDTRWHRWQLKEILSIGFTYRFSRI